MEIYIENQFYILGVHSHVIEFRARVNAANQVSSELALERLSLLKQIDFSA